MEMKTPGTALSCGARYVLIFMHMYLCLLLSARLCLQSVEADLLFRECTADHLGEGLCGESRQDQLKISDYWNRLFAGWYTGKYTSYFVCVHMHLLWKKTTTTKNVKKIFFFQLVTMATSYFSLPWCTKIAKTETKMNKNYMGILKSNVIFKNDKNTTTLLKLYHFFFLNNLI